MAPHADDTPIVSGVTDTTAVTIPDPILSKNLTRLADPKPSQRFGLRDVLPHREASAPMPPGVAAFSSADMFKSKSNASKPSAKDWSPRFTRESAVRKPSSLKGAMKYFHKDMISLCGGLPSSDYFPFENMSVTVPRSPDFSEKATKSTGVVAKGGKHDVRDQTSLLDLSIALNYGQSMGTPQIMRFVTEHTEIVHNPPYADWDVCVTIGSTSALDIALRMFCERGDRLITDDFTFSSAIETALPMGITPVGVKMDADGMIPSHLDSILSTWDEKTQGKKPFVIYLIPTGQNPTASTQPLERRKQIYALAEKHDLLILEDEPYYFLQMDPYKVGHTHVVSEPFEPSPPQTLLENLIPSYLSLDTSGRVLRMDSFSKVIAPGARAGWVTAPKTIVERFIRNQEVSSQTPAGFSIFALYKLLEEQWGHEGYLGWLSYIRAEYTRRRDIICNACEQYLQLNELVTWTPPRAGMFHWLVVDGSRHPEMQKLLDQGMPVRDILSEIEEKVFLAAVHRNVLVAKGSWFWAEKDNQLTASKQATNGSNGVSNGHALNGHVNGGQQEQEDYRLYFRMTFAAATEEQLTEAVKRFGEAMREEFKI